MVAPVVPKRKPVIRRLSPSLGMSRAIGLPVPNIMMTNDSPTSTSRAVPISSDRNSHQWKRSAPSHLGKLNDDLDVFRISGQGLIEGLRPLSSRDEPRQP